MTPEQYQSIRGRMHHTFVALAVPLLVVASLFGACDSRDFGDSESEIVIDVLVVYTDSARVEAGDIHSYLATVFDETNTVFANSQTGVRLEVVREVEVVYRLTDRLLDLERVLDPFDGYLDDIHDERDRSEADVVVFVTNSRASTANASIMATPETAFVIINRTDMGAPGYALAHELGHLFGARHSADRDPLLEPFAYGHGYRNDSIRTVVANGPQVVVPYFSTPRVEIDGVAIGDSSSADVTRVISETAAYVSNFRGTQTETPFVSPGTWPVLPTRNQ